MITFKTSQGSIYSFDEKRHMSSRQKKSGGSQQGKIFDYFNIVFVKKRPRVYNPEVRVVFGIYKSNGEFYEQSKVPKVISEDQKLVLIELRRKDNEPIYVQRAYIKPEIGFFPYEWGKNYENQSIRHIGNKIIEISEGNKVIKSEK